MNKYYQPKKGEMEGSLDLVIQNYRNTKKEKLFTKENSLTE